MVHINTTSASSETIDQAVLDTAFAADVAKLGISNVARCYQCLRCANGCPMAFAMDRTPSQVMRMATLGMKEELLGSSTIWLCSSCQTCTTRCPMDIDIAGVMDSLKEMALRTGVKPKESKIAKMHEIFNNIIKTRGRLFEPMLIGHYKMATKTFTDDMELGKKMMAKRKLRLWVPKIRGARKIGDMFAKVRAKKGGTGV